MKLLLDTHTLVWLLGESSHIPAPTLDLLQDQRNELVISAVSAFEIATKHNIGKFPEGGPVIRAYGRLLDELGARQLSISAHHGLIAGQLEWSHRDPFDRILAAQSIVESVPLVTADPVFASVGGVQTIW